MDQPSQSVLSRREHGGRGICVTENISSHNSITRMSNYATLDAHSRNCSACILQRKMSGTERGSEPRKQSHPSHCTTSHSSSSLTRPRRSNSCLSSTSIGTSLRDQLGEEDPAAYITPTQRKNQEIKRLRFELEKAKTKLISRDEEIKALKEEVAAFKRYHEQAIVCEPYQEDSESATDSGNCEEMVASLDAREGEEEVQEMNSIDFELMESTLREEEEYRQKLEDDNQKLQLNVSNLKEEIQRLKDNHIEEVSLLKKSQNDNICIVKKELHQKVENLINELAESSMRCARQQDTIETRQLKIDELLKEINDQKDDISKLQDLISEIKAKDDKTTDYCNSEEYLKNISYVKTVSSHCQVEPFKSVAITQTDDSLIANTSHALETNVELKTMSEAICDNKIHFTYQFLRRSIYYYITDKDNRDYHLKSIQRLLEFSDEELSTIHLTRNHQKRIAPTKKY